VTNLFEQQAMLADLLSDAPTAESGIPGLVMIEGAAGLGKSTLAGAFAGEASRELPEALVLRARCDALERDFPFGVVRQLFEPLVAEWPEELAECMFSGPAEPATQVFSSIPCVGPANGLGDTPRTVLHALFRLTLRIAAAGPLVLIVDDVHVADPPSLRWLRYLLRKATRSRILVVLTVRTDQQDGCLGILDPGPGYRTIRLERFTDKQVIDVLKDRLPVRASPELLECCARLTGGNPLLVRALITSMSVGLPAASLAASLSLAELPTQVVARFARFVDACLATQPTHVREFAAGLAVLCSAADGTEVAEVADLVGLDQHLGADAEDQLRELGLLAARDVRWAHPLICKCVLAELAPDLRERLHHKAAEQLRDAGADPERVGAHLLHVPGPRGPWVAAVLAAAAADAAIRGASESAARFLARALDESLSEPDRLRTELDLGLAEAVHRPAAAGGRLMAILDRLDDPAQQARAAEVLADVLLREARLDEAGETLSRLAALAAPDQRGTARWLSALRLAGQALQPWDETLLRELGQAEATLSASPQTPGDRALKAVLAAIAVNAPGWAAERVAELAEFALARGVHDIPALTVQHAVRALAAAGEIKQAVGYCDDAVLHARRAGLVLGLVTLLDARARIALQKGDPDEALKLHEESMVNLPIEHWGTFRTMPLATRLAIFTERGDLDAAGLLAADLQRAGDDTQLPIECAFARAAQGRTREALNLVLACQDLSPDKHALAARLFAELGEGEAAKESAQRSWDLASSWGTARAIGVALRARAEAESGPAAISLLSRSAAILDTPDTRLELAKSLLRLGETQAINGQRADARCTFHAAMAEAEGCAARGIADAARAGLREVGARPRARAVTGVDALTPSERRVVERASAGETNRDIAAALHLTLRTVETHLSAAYRKLRISGRDELSGVLVE
jgi:DNA-binding CsgD family transcriptional regulator/tetratricopeptide (TPR) repeat protein